MKIRMFFLQVEGVQGASDSSGLAPAQVSLCSIFLSFPHLFCSKFTFLLLSVLHFLCFFPLQTPSSRLDQEPASDTSYSVPRRITSHLGTKVSEGGERVIDGNLQINLCNFLLTFKWDTECFIHLSYFIWSKNTLKHEKQESTQTARTFTHAKGSRSRGNVGKVTELRSIIFQAWKFME